jgi:ABC-type spermidine/putrescine transport system permease subunit II
MKRDRPILLLTGSIAVALLYLPILLVIVFSFNSATRGMIWESFSLRWYREIWSDESIMTAVWNTSRVVALSSLLSLTFGLLAGYSVALSKRRLFTALLSCLFVSVLAPDLIMALAQALTYSTFRIPKGVLTIAVSHSTFGVAYVALFVAIRMKTIDLDQYLTTAESLGASPLRAARDHFLPLAVAPAVAGTSIVAAMSAQDFVYAFFCGGAATTTLSVKIYGMVKFGVNSSINVIYVALALIVLLLFWTSETFWKTANHS